MTDRLSGPHALVDDLARRHGLAHVWRYIAEMTERAKQISEGVK